MKSDFQLKIAILVISSMLPWPESPNNSSGCSREFSFLVRNFVFQKWTPIFKKYKVEIPLDCPLHPLRDMFDSFHKSKVRVHSKQWSCFLCGKSFFSEQYLDLHLLNKHHNRISLMEDSVCPADFCDLVRCQVLRYTEIIKKKNTSNEDTESHKQGQQQVITALAKATSGGLNSLSRYNHPNNFCLTDDELCKKKGWLILPSELQQRHCCSPGLEPSINQLNATIVGCNHSNMSSSKIETSGPTSEEEELAAEMKQKQDLCNDDNFILMRSKCASLIDSCTTGLILQMTDQEFYHFQGELNRSVCWHLQCDRYWQEISSSEANPSTLFILAVAFVLAGFSSSYVIVCVLCQ